MSKKKHRGAHEEHVNHERWLLTYSDMITLLLALFIFLYSISEINVQKLNAFSDAMANIFGIGRVPESSTSNSGGDGVLPESNSIVRLQKKVSKELEKLIQQDMVDVTETEEGLRVLLKDRIVFTLGNADVTSQAKKMLRELSVNLVDLPNEIRIEGHTDNLPMAKNSKYPSNWELSSARAISVARFFIEQCNIDPKRLTVAGYAEYHPRKPNYPVVGNAENRRVEIVILRNQKDSAPVKEVLPHTDPIPELDQESEREPEIDEFAPAFQH